MHSKRLDKQNTSLVQR